MSSRHVRVERRKGEGRGGYWRIEKDDSLPPFYLHNILVPFCVWLLACLLSISQATDVASTARAAISCLVANLTGLFCVCKPIHRFLVVRTTFGDLNVRASFFFTKDEASHDGKRKLVVAKLCKTITASLRDSNGGKK